ncbi:MAG: DUF5668 domain-containing protein [Chloroflexota bacterium]|nr:DUF5668 domain-containing protein [Chloroflexota bacterium]
MRMNHRLLFWGLGFLSAGLVALAIQQNLLDRDVMASAWRLWPLILVAVGVSLILSRTPYALVGTALSAIVIGTIAGTAIAVGPLIGISCSSGSEPTELTTSEGSFASSASLDWQMNCGDLTVSVNSSSVWTAAVARTNGPTPNVEGSAERLKVTSGDSGDFLAGGKERWEIGLPVATTYAADIQTNAVKATMNLSGSHFSSFSIQPNAANVRIDLTDAGVSDLDLQLNAGSSVITASNGTSLSGQIEENAGSVHLCTPTDAALRITVSGIAFGTNLGDSNLSHDGDTWESSTYTSAEHKITLTVHGNAASFDLNPTGGC